MVTEDFNVQGWGTQILPFIEQSGLYGQYDSRVPAFNEVDQFTSPFNPFDVNIAKENIARINTVFEIFLCPSAPGGDQRKYNAAVTPDFYGPGIPPIPLSWSAAPSDYCPLTGVHPDFASIAFSSSVPVRLLYGAIQPAGVVENRSSRISDITDGLSNTLLLGERMGGPDIYHGWKKAPPSSDNDINGGGWGDFLNGEHWLKGSEYDGTPGTLGGPCGINCTNQRSLGFFSWHPGGCYLLLCDGSARFVSETISQRVLASIGTRAGGETFSWEE
jgi:hypothetical protein